MKARRIASVLSGLGIAAAGLVIVPTAQATPQGCDSRTNNSVKKLLTCVTLKGVLEHEKAFQKIADENDGNRAAGTSGYDASVDYVERRLERAGYRVTRQAFEFFDFRELGPSVLQQTAPTPTTYVEDTDFSVTDHSPRADITSEVTPVDIQLGIGNTSTSGCEASDFIDVAGDIVLIQRGGAGCTFELKGENAAAAGAVGIVFMNQGNTAAADRNGIPAVTLGNGYTGGIPAINVTYALGATLSATSGLRMRLFANVSRLLSENENLIAESRTGDPHNVVMAGAHLDSVHEGPGINDNGSGSASLIEVAEQMAKLKLPNKVRFAWWGAEEANLVGSNFYVSQLDAEGRADIEMYLNFDMVASPNYGLFAYDGDGSDFGLIGPPGSDEIEALFEEYYADRDIPQEASPFNGRSDYQAFILNDIPAGGLFTGAEGIKTADQAAKWGGTAGVAYDPCYHSACDTIANLSHEALDINSDAIAYAVYLYASGKREINAG